MIWYGRVNHDAKHPYQKGLSISLGNTTFTIQFWYKVANTDEIMRIRYIFVKQFSRSDLPICVSHRNDEIMQDWDNTWLYWHSHVRQFRHTARMPIRGIFFFVLNVHIQCFIYDEFKRVNTTDKKTENYVPVLFCVRRQDSLQIFLVQCFYTLLYRL